LAANSVSSWTTTASKRALLIDANVDANCSGLRNSYFCSSSFKALAMTSNLWNIGPEPLFAGFTSTATRPTRGRPSLTISSRFAITSDPKLVDPVMLPPGRARLLISPRAIRSLLVAGITSGI
jgi:hypothetical protein